MNMDYSAYEGTVVPGKVDTVMSRGKVVIADGEYSRAEGSRAVPDPRAERVLGMRRRSGGPVGDEAGNGDRGPSQAQTGRPGEPRDFASGDRGPAVGAA